MTFEVYQTKTIMKKLIAVFLISIVAFGCEDPNVEETNLDEYYIKYEVSISTMYSNQVCKATIKDEKGNMQTFVPGRSFEIIIGPVNKGFNALLIATPVSSAPPAEIFLTLSVSKNDGPFAQKGTNDGGTYNSVPIELSHRVE